mgnify:CR=1 FL=1
MKKNLLFAIAAMLAFMNVFAQDVNEDIIEIVFNGSTATVTVPTSITDVTYNVSGADVMISSGTTTTEYTYRVSGESTSGSLLINGEYKLTLQLDGLNLTNPNGGAAIDVECGKRTDFILMEGTVNTITDSEFGAQKGAIYFKGHADFKGSGTLNVTGKLKHAICAKEEIELKSSLGTINVLGAISDGIHCGRGKVANEHNFFQMDGGTVNIKNVGSDGVDADDYGCIRINGGAINVNIGTLKTTGIKADSLLYVNGGDININVSGPNCEAMRSCYATYINDGNINIVVTGEGSKGIKSKEETENSTVLDGGNMEINGGNIEIFVTGNSYVKADGSTSKCMCISVDKNLTQTGGDVYLTAMGPETKSHNVKGTNEATSGTFKITRGPWLMDTFDLDYEMSIFARAYRNGLPLTDYSNVAIGAFIGTECMGIAEFEVNEYGIVRVKYDSTDNDPVIFKLYDYLTETEYELTADQEVLFDPQGLYGTPSNPVRLNYEVAYVIGDVNMDGTVDVSDITAISYHIFGTTPEIFNYDAADANTDGTIDVSDITAIAYQIFGQNSKQRAKQADSNDPQ